MLAFYAQVGVVSQVVQVLSTLKVVPHLSQTDLNLETEHSHLATDYLLGLNLTA